MEVIDADIARPSLILRSRAKSVPIEAPRPSACTAPDLVGRGGTPLESRRKAETAGEYRALVSLAGRVGALKVAQQPPAAAWEEGHRGLGLMVNSLQDR